LHSIPALALLIKYHVVPLSHHSRYAMSDIYLFASRRTTALPMLCSQLIQQPQGVAPVPTAKRLSHLIGNADIGTFRYSVDLTDIVCSKLYAANPHLLPCGMPGIADAREGAIYMPRIRYDTSFEI
jgi:hypothetical protein